MKTKSAIAILVIFLVAFTGCQEQKQEQTAAVEVTKVDLINDEFPEAKQEVMELDKEIDRLMREDISASNKKAGKIHSSDDFWFLGNLPAFLSASRIIHSS